MRNETAHHPAGLSRRTLLRAGALGGAALAATPFITACQPAQNPASPAPSSPASAARTARRLTLSWWTDIGFPSPFAFIPLAAAYGWEHVVVSTRSALDQALTSPVRGPQLIEVPLER